jgi:hypothetical protein
MSAPLAPVVAQVVAPASKRARTAIGFMGNVLAASGCAEKLMRLCAPPKSCGIDRGQSAHPRRLTWIKATP